MSTFPQMDGMARPELGQCRVVGPSEARFRWVNGKRRATNDGIRWPSLNILMDGSCVDVILDRVILARRSSTIGEEVVTVVDVSRF